jgi:hypothetical protein
MARVMLSRFVGWFCCFTQGFFVHGTLPEQPFAGLNAGRKQFKDDRLGGLNRLLLQAWVGPRLHLAVGLRQLDEIMVFG